MAAAQQVKRNDPCPCGSGRKYKSCCGRPVPGGRRPTPAPAAPKPDPQTLLQQAAGYLQARQFDLAEPVFEEVRRLRPRSAPALAGLGQIAAQRGDHETGVDLLRQAIRIEPKYAFALVWLSDLLLQTGDADGALDAGRRAIAIEPRNLRAHCAVASCLGRMNRTDEALEAAHAAHDIDAQDANTIIILGSPLRRTGDVERARTMLDELVLERRDLDPFLVSLAQHELGLALDTLGEHEAAFDVMLACGTFKPVGSTTMAAEQDRWLQVIQSWRNSLDERPLPLPATPPFDEPAPAFLVGFPRSGTTMTEQILAAHPDVVTSDEQELIRAVRMEMQRLHPEAEDLPAALHALTEEEARRLRRLYWKEAHRATGVSPDTSRFVDKLPLNIVDLGLIQAIFPDARIIVALRDPRDVCLSCLFQWFALNEAMTHFQGWQSTANFYDAVMGWWLQLREQTSLAWIEVRYEDTVTDLAGQARRMLEHLDVPWDDGVLQFHTQAQDRLVSTPSFEAVTETVHARSVGKWSRHARRFDARIMERLTPYIEAFGYAAGPVSSA